MASTRYTDKLVDIDDPASADTGYTSNPNMDEVDTGPFQQPKLHCISLRLEPWSVNYVVPLSKVDTGDKLLNVLTTFAEIGQHFNISHEDVLRSTDLASSTPEAIREMKQLLMVGKWEITGFKDCKIRFQDWADLLYSGANIVITANNVDGSSQQRQSTTAATTTSNTYHHESSVIVDQPANDPWATTQTTPHNPPELIGWDDPPNPNLMDSWDNNDNPTISTITQKTANLNLEDSAHKPSTNSWSSDNNSKHNSRLASNSHDPIHDNSNTSTFDTDDWRLLNESPNIYPNRASPGRSRHHYGASKTGNTYSPFHRNKNNNYDNGHNYNNNHNPAHNKYKQNIPAGPLPTTRGKGKPFHFVIFHGIHPPIEFPYDRTNVDVFDDVYKGDVEYWVMMKYVYYKFYIKGDKRVHWRDRELVLTRLVVREVGEGGRGEEGGGGGGAGKGSARRELVRGEVVSRMGSTMIEELGVSEREKNYFLLE